MATTKYEKLILDTLQGRTEELQGIPPERLDWSGPGALLELYDRTSGKDRTEIIRAIGRLIQEHTAPVDVIAQLVDLASSLDLAEVEPNIEVLRTDPVGSKEPLHGAIINFLTYREMQPSRVTVSARGRKSSRAPSRKK